MIEHKKEYYFMLLLGVASWWLVDFFADEVAVVKEIPPHSSDYFSIGYKKMEMDLSGKPVNELVADRMTHFSDDNTVEMLNPVMTFYNESTPPWVVSSETGLLSADGKNLYLNGMVFIVREQAPGVREVKVNTTNLKVRPDESYAETDEWAELIAPPDWVSGTGMKVFFQAPIHLEFLSNVRSKYESM